MYQRLVQAVGKPAGVEPVLNQPVRIEVEF
jgi:hypothetical protein